MIRRLLRRYLGSKEPTDSDLHDQASAYGVGDSEAEFLRKEIVFHLELASLTMHFVDFAIYLFMRRFVVYVKNAGCILMEGLFSEDSRSGQAYYEIFKELMLI